MTTLAEIHFPADLVQFEDFKHSSTAEATAGEGKQAFSFPRNQVLQVVYHALYLGMLSINGLLSQYQLAHFVCLREYHGGIRS